MSLTQILGQAWGSARLKVLGPQRFFEIESKKALDDFLEAPVKRSNIQSALKYFTVDQLASALREHSDKYRRDYEDLAKALKAKGEERLSADFIEQVAKSNQLLYSGMMALYESQHNPKG